MDLNVQSLVDDPSFPPLIDVGAVPWSRRGSFVALSTLTQRPDVPAGGVEPGLYVWDVSGSRRGRWSGVFRFDALSGGAIGVDAVTPALMRLSVGDGTVEAVFDGPQTLRVRGSGTCLRLTEVGDRRSIVVPQAPGAWRLQMSEDAHYVVACLRGTMAVTGPKVRGDRGSGIGPNTVTVMPDGQGRFEFALTQYESAYRAPAARRDFDECVAEVTAEFNAWAAEFPAVSPDLRRAAGLAAYVQWSCLVDPRGILARPAMLMSKNWMNAVWSWDHCFNALGLARSHPELAWDQFMLPFDHQHPSGALPDVVHDNGRIWGFVKPPIHGWTLAALMKLDVVTDTQLAEAYPKLAAWTRFWLDFRDDDGDGLCEYLDGCDSGQDNTTAFDAIGFPAAAPDLAAFLIVQMDTLAEVATRLGDTVTAASWQRQADTMLAALLDRLWDGDRFRILHAGAAAATPPGLDQFAYLPLILGPRLPPPVRRRLVTGLRASGLLTGFGLASESPTSPHYEPDGYWRGPIWAPTTLLVAVGLAACEEHELAQALSAAFLRTCRDSGFAENYEATTGKALRDPGYSWSASVFWTLSPQASGRG
ncbi:amylo-alpha-1,6-glucosidase [Catenulispora subtropica]|uniref:Trehalase family glycosidase n=1 Tax=Catenulispora subtropica TaxID=450798 RepID=A0ABN2QYT7_9ACTN